MENKTTNKILSALLFSLVATASINTAQAELVDLSNPEPMIRFTSSDASWLIKPRFDYAASRLDKYLTTCSYDQHGEIIKSCKKNILKMNFLLQVDKQGNVTNTKIVKSSGITEVDSLFSREFKKARFKPFINNGQAVKGTVAIPITFQ